MGYHVSIVRTVKGKGGISAEEVTGKLGRELGFSVQLTSSGAIEQVYKQIDGQEMLLFFDDGRLWTKNPSEATLRAMIDIAGALGDGARVRGDEGETYVTVDETYTHPDDRDLLDQTPRFYWKDVASRALPLFAALLLLYALARLALKHLG